jgi:hypothetical protein
LATQARAAALTRSLVDRLRTLTRAALDRLAVVAQLERWEGTLVRVPGGPPEPREEGVRISEGAIQLGLSRRELDGIAERLRQLLERFDRGEIALF